jgi:hypothetical protein
MAAQLALLDAQRQRLLQQRGVVSVASSLVSSRRSTSSAARPESPRASWRQDLGKAAHIDGALQAVERRQARGVLGRDVAVGVVLDDVEVVLLAGQPRCALPGDRQ